MAWNKSKKVVNNKIIRKVEFYFFFCYNLIGGNVKNNKLYILIFLLILFFLFSLIFVIKRPKVYSKNLLYMDTYINIKINSNKKNNIEKIFKDVEKIYKEYHYLTDKYNQYDKMINVYYINNNKVDDEFLIIDKKLYDIINYSLDWYEKSNGVFDIGFGNVIDIWKKYINDKNGIPSYEELVEAKLNYKEIVLQSPNKILNNHPNIDLGGIAKGYATDIVGQYLKEQGINDYIINAGGQVLVGEKNNSEKYKIGIKNPDSEGHLIVVNGSNISVATSGGYERFYEYNGNKYHHIINPTTLYPSNYMKSISVISPYSKLSDVLTTLLFIMPIEDGKKLVDSLPEVEALWYSNDNKIIKSKGFSIYE